MARENVQVKFLGFKVETLNPKLQRSITKCKIFLVVSKVAFNKICSEKFCFDFGFELFLALLGLHSQFRFFFGLENRYFSKCCRNVLSYTTAWESSPKSYFCNFKRFFVNWVKIKVITSSIPRCNGSFTLHLIYTSNKFSLRERHL